MDATIEERVAALEAKVEQLDSLNHSVENISQSPRSEMKTFRHSIAYSVESAELK